MKESFCVCACDAHLSMLFYILKWLTCVRARVCVCVWRGGHRFVDWLLVDRGTLRDAPTRRLFSNHPYPSRNVNQNLSDLRAQVAANACGVGELHKLVADFGLETVRV